MRKIVEKFKFKFEMIKIASSVYTLIVLKIFRNILVLFQIQYNYDCC